MTGPLVPRYTFETFTPGRTTASRAAAVAVAEAPGTACNPLLIYGGLRLGRTHLLHAIGTYAQELHPSLDIRYVRAAEFGRQFAIAAGDGREDDLRRRYLDAGMLLVDDVQLLPDAEAIRAEFLHVITALHDGGRQLVISAGRAPRLLAGLDDSLRDRLERGLAAELGGYVRACPSRDGNCAY
jgi:chromosomal replication initiator protein